MRDREWKFTIVLVGGRKMLLIKKWKKWDGHFQCSTYCEFITNFQSKVNHYVWKKSTHDRYIEIHFELDKLQQSRKQRLSVNVFLQGIETIIDVLNKIFLDLTELVLLTTSVYHEERRRSHGTTTDIDSSTPTYRPFATSPVEYNVALGPINMNQNNLDIWY